MSKSILSFNCVLIVCVLLTAFITLQNSSIVSASSSSSGNGTVREWLTDLNGEAATLQSSASILEKVIALLSTANNTASIINIRKAQLKKINQALDLLNQEISIVKLTCNNNGGPDCTIPVCVPICLNCSGPGKCGVCPYNFDGNDCSSCKSGWSNFASNCTIPICDSKCKNCSSPGVCIACSDNWDGPSCSACKQGWNGLTCSVPVCDSKCLNCSAPANCSSCIGNWIGSACSTCKSGWSGSNCSTPVCDAKCTTCTSPGACSVCSGNYDGATCSTCKTGWTGPTCTTPACDAKCTTCASPGVCSVCSTGWTGATCSTPVCDAKCTTCASPGVCSVCSGNYDGATCSGCKSGLYGSDCSSTSPIPILTSAQITKFSSTIMSAQLTSSKLLYKATRDGFSASAFHSKCDNKGATIVIAKAATGAIFGGYTSVSWTSGTGSYTTDNNAFIFSLISSTQEERFTKLTFQNGFFKTAGYTNNDFAMSSDVNRGPRFGYEIVIPDNSNVNMLYSTNLCYVYCDTTMKKDTSVAQTYLAGSTSYLLSDYEVYSL